MTVVSIDAKDLKSLIMDRFEYLKDQVVDELVELGELYELDSSNLVIHQGDTTQDVYFLLSGRAAVYIEDDSGLKKINEIACGEFFGEMSVFTQVNRSASIVTIRHSILLKIAGDAFMTFLDHHPSLYKSISQTLIHRLANANKKKSIKKSSKLIALYSPYKGYKLNDFAEKLRKELASFGPALIVRDDEFAEFSRTQAELSAFINKAESANEYVLLVCTNTNEVITKQMIGYSDEVFVVRPLANQTSEFLIPPIPVSDDFPAHNLRSFLVLDSRGTDKIEGSKKCTYDMPEASLIHLHKDKDMARIARLISGNSTKLVLSGGGARGLAHLGVYKAIKELGIEVDAVSATSIGSIMGAIVALDWDFDFAVEESHKAFILSKPLSDYHVPLVSLLKGKRLEKTIKDRFQDLYIEDLPIPYLAIASNLSNMSTEIINSGLVRDAVRASISIPSVLPPVVRNGKLLVDGGIVDNMPYDPIQNVCDGPTIGVDLSTLKERELGYEKIPSNFRLTKAKFGISKKVKVPSIYQIVMGTMTLASDEKKRQNISKFDLYIQPKVYKYGFLNFKNIDELIEEGYQSSIHKLEGWLKTSKS